MFQVKDKNGQEIYLRDKLLFEIQVDDLMGDTGEAEGYAIGFPSEGIVEIQPLGGGIPVLLPADEVEVKDSLVQRVANLGSHEEFQKLIFDAEKRYQEAVENGKVKRKGGGKKAAPAQQTEVEF